jgi:hypothetical protein
MIITERDLERSGNLQICNIEIVTDSGREGFVELYMLDEKNERIEGGEFDSQLFLDHVFKFYNDNY